MQSDYKTVLLISMPFAETSIPSIQLALLEAYLKERNVEAVGKHLYLRAADFYSLNNYNLLINSPNDSYTAQMVFSKYVFSEHWEKTKNSFRDFYNNLIAYNKKLSENFPFDRYVKETDNFYNWVCKEINCKDFDIIGFTLNYGQFLPSLSVAKYIKENYPEKKIVFGGSTTIGELGKRVLKAFKWIDYIISGDGEEPLYLLASNTSVESIPGLILRKNNEIRWDESNNSIDLNQLPFPDYSSFYQDLSQTSPDLQQYYALRGRLPIEFSRGCWWNKCTFCNLRAYHKNYREKTVERFIEELNFLSKTYKMLSFQFIGNTLPQYDYKELCESIINLGKDFTFYVEARAGQLNSEDYILLKKAGFINIQTGIETFSKNYLKKMNKGANVIDNIAALKYCRENGITNHYNIIINYPNEESIDFEENKRNISNISQYLDPPQISTFYVGYDSPIYNNLEKFNIERLEYKKVDKIMYPTEVLEHGFFFFYNFTRNQNIEKNNWEYLVNKWNIEQEMLTREGIKSKNLVDKYIFYFVDGGNFIKIYDKRSLSNVQIFNLDEIERKIFLSCLDVISWDNLKEKLSSVSEETLISTLEEFVENGIVFREDDRYLALPLSYRKIKGIDYRKKQPVTDMEKKEILQF